MSRTTRTLLRTAAPPLLALALATALVHPLADDAAAASLPSTGGHVTATDDHRDDRSSDHRAAPSGNIAVSVPVVAFQKSVRVTASHLRTAVLVNIAAPRGVATVVGQPGCRVDAAPGRVAWLDCAVTRDLDEATVKVVLADHRVYTRTVATERR
jgi:hypothetical protein